VVAGFTAANRLEFGLGDLQYCNDLRDADGDTRIIYLRR
jgi:hypothetical protein